MCAASGQIKRGGRTSGKVYRVYYVSLQPRKSTWSSAHCCYNLLYLAASRLVDNIGRKVPRSSFERDRRPILKLVPKLLKIKPAKGR